MRVVISNFVVYNGFFMNIFRKTLKKFGFEKLISDGAFENDTADNKPGMSVFESSTTSINKEPPARKTSEYLKEMKGWVYSCINAISDSIADTQWKLYKYNAAGEVEEVFEHPILDVLYKVNEFTTKFDHFWLTQATLELTGEAPWYLEKDTKGNILNMYILRPDRINILFDKDSLISGYKYVIKKGGRSETITLASDEVIFLKYPNPDNPYRGLGTLQAVARTVDIENYAEKWNEKFFYNSARPDGLLTVKVKRLTDEQKKKLKSSIREYYQSVDNAHKLMVLSGDMDYKQFSLSQKDMDFMEQQTFSRNKILGIFRVPKVIVSQTDGVNYANAKTAERIFALYTIKPKLQRIAEQLNEFFVPLFSDGDNLFLDYVDPVLEELDDKVKRYKAGLGESTPYLTINEVRKLENLAPLEGDTGDQVYIPAGLVSIGKIGEIKKDLYLQNSNVLKSFKARTKDTRKLDGMRTDIRKIVRGKLKESRRVKNAKPKKKIKALDLDIEQKELFWNKQIKVADKFEAKFISAMNSIFERQKKQVMASVKLEDGKKSLTKAGIKKKSLLNKVKEQTIGVLIFNPLFKDVVKQEGQVASNLLDKELLFDVDSPEVRKFITNRPKDFLSDITETTNERIKKEINEGIKEGEGINKIRTRIGLLFDNFKSYRSERIARSEVIRASNFATEQSYIQSGVVEGKEWLTAFDERTCAACAEMNGKIEILGKNFFDKGDNFSGLDLSYEDIGFPPLHPMCRCSLIPFMKEIKK